MQFFHHCGWDFWNISQYCVACGLPWMLMSIFRASRQWVERKQNWSGRISVMLHSKTLARTSFLPPSNFRRESIPLSTNFNTFFHHHFSYGHTTLHFSDWNWNHKRHTIRNGMNCAYASGFVTSSINGHVHSGFNFDYEFFENAMKDNQKFWKRKVRWF